MKKIIILMVLVLNFTLLQAKEVLKVVFVFDKTTTNYSSNQRNSISEDLLLRLNESFINSGLSSKISFQRVAYLPRYVSNNGESLENIADRYDNTRSGSSKTTRLKLHELQKYYEADIVVTIMEPGSTSLCGIAIDIPETINDLKYGDNGFIFLSNEDSCLDSQSLIAHEVGHTFGLHHGKAVADDRGVPENYKVNSISNGYGVLVDYGMNYSTIMSKDIVFSEKGIGNFFSDPNKYECGFWDSDRTNVCGNSTANATKFISDNVRFYNMRGDWYK
jgi:hypothetical protein